MISCIQKYGDVIIVLSLRVVQHLAARAWMALLINWNAEWEPCDWSIRPIRWSVMTLEVMEQSNDASNDELDADAVVESWIWNRTIQSIESDWIRLNRTKWDGKKSNQIEKKRKSQIENQLQKGEKSNSTRWRVGAPPRLSAPRRRRRGLGAEAGQGGARALR